MATTFAGKPAALRRWETLTKAVLVMESVFVAVYVLLAAIGVTGTLSRAERVALIGWGLVAVPIKAGWLNQARRLLRSFGDDAKRLGRDWSNLLSFVLLVAGLMAFARDHRSPAFPALLAVSTAFAMLSTGKTRWLVHGVAVGEIAPQDADHESLPAAPGGPTVRRDALPDTPVPAPADDDFWAAAARASSDAALLETLPTLARRWVQLPTDGDVTALRTSIPAGATLTLWPAPLARDGEPPAAPEYYGLRQATADGPTRFQLILPSRVAGFAAETRAAHRAALYLPDDPAARTARQPG